MIAELPGKLLILFALLTLFGIVIGYCVALIRAKHAAKKAIDLVRLEIAQERRAVESDLRTAKNDVQRLRESGAQGETTKHSELAGSPSESSEDQAAHIVALEAQVTELEDKQLRLQRDFASYKSTKTRQLELARSASSTLVGAHDLPTLSRRVETAAGSPRGRRGDLSYPLSSDLDIPSLAESELSGSGDEMDFDIADSGRGAKTRG